MVKWVIATWAAVLSLAACAYEIDEGLCLRNSHCDDDEVCGINQSCIPCSGASCPPSRRCETDDDCSEEEVCADDLVCRTRCVVDAQCAKSGKCAKPFCQEAFGQPCLDGVFIDTEYIATDCVGFCATTNNQLEPVPGYCSDRCFSQGCPTGYECIDGDCLIVSDDGAICQYPNRNAPCGACLWDNCSSELFACCEGQICMDASSAIQQCDEARTTTACSILSDPLRFAPASRELMECLSTRCDDGECF